MAIEQTLIEYAGKGAGWAFIGFASIIFSGQGIRGFKKARKYIMHRFNPKDEYVESAIVTAIDELKTKTGATHVWLSQYSNGKQSFAGLCFKHFTMIYESVSIGREKIKSLYRNIPAEDYLDFKKAMSESANYYVWDSSTEIDTPVAYLSHGIKMAVEWKLKNSDFNMGHICVAFDKECEVTEEMKVHMKFYGKSILGLIKMIKK